MAGLTYLEILVPVPGRLLEREEVDENDSPEATPGRRLGAAAGHAFCDSFVFPAARPRLPSTWCALQMFAS
jgi:hypothetical protein